MGQHINIRKDTNMKDTKQIAEDCGCDYKLLLDVMEDDFQCDRPLEKELSDMIGALYRRIEKLEKEKSAELEENQRKNNVAMDLLTDKIRELGEEKECHIAEIKALESAVAGNASRIEKLEEEKQEAENALYRALFPHPSAHEVRMYGTRILAGREVS
jgi:dGTP triphosphohydrolase